MSILPEPMADSSGGARSKRRLEDPMEEIAKLQERLKAKDRLIARQRSALYRAKMKSRKCPPKDSDPAHDPAIGAKYAELFKAIMEDADSEEPFATFMKDQMKNRLARKPGYRWSATTIKYCLLFQGHIVKCN